MLCTPVAWAQSRGFIVTIYPAPRPVTTNGTPFRDSLADAVATPSLWESTLGSGTITKGAGTLTLGSGTTANNTTSLLSQQSFHLPTKVAIGLSISQRITNQTFFVELVSIDPQTEVPNGLDNAGFVFDGTNAFQAKHQVTTGGLSVNQSALSAYPSTASPAKLFEIEASADEVWFHGSNGLDQTTNRANSYRLQLKSPDPNALYKLRLRWLNGATAPASNTNALVTYISVGEYEELVTEMRNGRGNAVAGNAMSVIETYSATSGPLLFTSVAAAAAVIKGSAGRIFGISMYNTTGAIRYARFYNKATTPMIGTDMPVMVLPIGASSGSNLFLTSAGRSFGLGIGIAVTTDATLLGSTVAGVNDVLASIDYS
jgi:hypothetical protein